MTGKFGTALFFILVCWLWPRGAYPSCITVVWKSPGDDAGYGTAQKYDIRYSTLPLNESNWSFAQSIWYEPRPMPAGSVQNVNVGGLVPGLRYYIGVRAVDNRANVSRNAYIMTAIAPEEQCNGVLGNVDCDPEERIDIADLTTLIDYLYISQAPMCCPEEANVNGDSFGDIDVGDLTNLINILFNNAPLPPQCR